MSLSPYIAIQAIIAFLGTFIGVYGIHCTLNDYKASENKESIHRPSRYYLPILIFTVNALHGLVMLTYVVWISIAYDYYWADFRDYDVFPLLYIFLYLWHLTKTSILWMCNARLYYTFHGMSGKNMQISKRFYYAFNVISAISMFGLCSISIYGFTATTSLYIRRVGLDSARAMFSLLMICIVVLFNKRLYLKTIERKTVRTFHKMNANSDKTTDAIDNITADIEQRDQETHALLDTITRYSILVTVWCITMITLIIFFILVFVISWKGIYAAMAYYSWTIIVDSFCVLCLYQPISERIDCYNVVFKCNDNPKCKTKSCAIHYCLDKTCVECAKKYGSSTVYDTYQKNANKEELEL